MERYEADALTVATERWAWWQSWKFIITRVYPNLSSVIAQVIVLTSNLIKLAMPASPLLILEQRWTSFDLAVARRFSINSPVYVCQRKSFKVFRWIKIPRRKPSNHAWLFLQDFPALPKTARHVTYTWVEHSAAESKILDTSPYAVKLVGAYCDCPCPHGRRAVQ